ncbi:DoxX family membrane protein [Cryobacterium sp. TMT1-21]|uniref:DoxX family membrane protein n=1 Tax=Cryobacterium shii TaxID=1259235 RepID=A0AAQ2C3Z2_9MICO|nr:MULTISPECIES: DoxX family membrane protein [Cryobacterium]TFC41756.1 DoxX family membrane protein [Cryobacterium shii]TFC88729.1 DoxX family membrane protein [Cryobacterium sp. TmT2-59]TFD12308.1 DoxX family membrane protein [Cryobacterium sp. TMT1-21]TFD16773.1 DoxX family membrane protein [Cryobacterium sp. TMT4-10]TFD21038.1 DoxX family membrane protein [Cryobacterium sp. TMT2-23]
MSIVTFPDVQWALRIVLAVVFIGAGITHFLPPVARTMAAMIPPRLRFAGPLSPRNLVIVTGLCEIAGGIGLLIGSTIVTAGVSLVVFLAAVFPANAFAARYPDRFGPAAIPLVPRLIGQLVLMGLIVVAIL